MKIYDMWDDDEDGQQFCVPERNVKLGCDKQGVNTEHKHERKICSWYGPCGALVTNEPVIGLTNKTPLEPDISRYYGGDYMIAESMSERAAITISQALGLEYRGYVVMRNIVDDVDSLRTHMSIIRYENGMTVAELKRLIVDWPETDEYGVPCEVWLGDGRGLSNVVKEASPLNSRESEDGSRNWADFMLSHDE